MREAVVVVVPWGCGEPALASYPHIHGRRRGIFIIRGWRARRAADSPAPTGVWLLGSVVRGSGLTRLEMPPPSPASSLNKGSTLWIWRALTLRDKP